MLRSTRTVFQQDPQNSQQVAWTGINMPVKKTRTFRIKLAVDQCAGDTLVPGRHNKTAKATSLYSSDIMIGTFTGPINDMECMVGKTVTVRKMAGGEFARAETGMDLLTLY